MISVCVTIKNRSRVTVADRELMLFPNCVQSIAHSLSHPHPIASELVVADWNSNDWPLAEWLEETAAPVPVQLLQLDGTFNRGHGRNVAAQAARGDKLLFLDADSLICPEVIQRGLKHLREGKAYFPVLYSYNGPEHKTGYWRHAGYGNCMVNRQMFNQVQGWPEHDAWGKEDTGFHSLFQTHSHVVREEVPGFYHQWHPDELAWKDQYTKRGPQLQEEALRIQITTRQLNNLIPEGETFILVDEARFGNATPTNRTALPFTEHNGQFWGPPADDTAALSELKRLHAKGANFITFTWITFWWLDFYKDLNQHLRSHFPCVLENENLVVFDLRPTPNPPGGSA